MIMAMVRILMMTKETPRTQPSAIALGQEKNDGERDEGGGGGGGGGGDVKVG